MFLKSTYTPNLRHQTSCYSLPYIMLTIHLTARRIISSFSYCLYSFVRIVRIRFNWNWFGAQRFTVSRDVKLTLDEPHDVFGVVNCSLSDFTVMAARKNPPRSKQNVFTPSYMKLFLFGDNESSCIKLCPTSLVVAEK